MAFEKIKRACSIFVLISSVIFVGMLFIKGFGDGWSNVSIWLWNMSISDSIFKIVAAICGIGFSIFIFIMISKIKCVEKILSYCGANSLVIYSIHPIIVAMPFMSIGYSRVVIGFIVSMIFALLTGFVLRRFWLIRAVVFGEIKDLRRIVAYGNSN
jgi:fucose 4-O-acetylase-like acetyltransferase